MRLALHVFCIMLLLLYVTIGESKTILGPYNAKVFKSEACEKPSRPYEKVRTMVFTCDIYNTTKASNLLTGNLTVLRNDPDIRMSVKTYLLEDNKWKIIYVVNSKGCRSLVLDSLKIALNIVQTGCVKKGTYHFQGIDFNKVAHRGRAEALYGMAMWKIEIGTKLGTSICWEYTVLTEPESI